MVMGIVAAIWLISHYHIPSKFVSAKQLSFQQVSLIHYHSIRGGANMEVIEGGEESKLLRIINDRKILEFLLSRNGREVLRKSGIGGLGDISVINHLDMISMAPVKSDTTVSEAAGLLMDIRTPCLILEGDTDHYIVTPWDIVMKTLRSESTPIIVG